MNLIKFKETIVDNRVGSDWEWYNENLRGKYAYWVRCHYVIPLDAITPNMYVSFETTINNLLGYEYYRLTESNGDYSYVLTDDRDLSYNIKKNAPVVEVIPENPTSESPAVVKLCYNTIHYADLWEGDYYWMNSFIDYTETDVVNSIDKYKVYNSYVPEGDLTTEDLKKFRTWLATSLLGLNYSYYLLFDESGEYEYVPLSRPSLDQLQNAVLCVTIPEEPTADSPEVIKIHNLDIKEWSDDEQHMLDYYAGGMYDDTLKWLSVYGGVDVSITGVNLSSCGCAGSSNLSSLYKDTLSVCDTVSIYRSGIKSKMVSLFSNMDMWSSLPETYILLIKEYIDGIIQSNFALGVSDQSNYYTCECLNKNGQDAGMAVLKQLSTAFEYIATKDISGHKNFITTVLTTWSNELYEIMEW